MTALVVIALLAQDAGQTEPPLVPAEPETPVGVVPSQPLAPKLLAPKREVSRWERTPGLEARVSLELGGATLGGVATGSFGWSLSSHNASVGLASAAAAMPFAIYLVGWSLGHRGSFFAAVLGVLGGLALDFGLMAALGPPPSPLPAESAILLFCTPLLGGLAGFELSR